MVHSYSKNNWTQQEWDQIINLRKADFIFLLHKDERWHLVKTNGAHYVYRNPHLKSPHNYLTIRFGMEMFINKSLLGEIIDHTRWTGGDLRRWKVIE